MTQIKDIETFNVINLSTSLKTRNMCMCMNKKK